jgi:hypothetical protein
MLDRNLAPERKLTDEDRRAEAALTQSVELRDVADEAMAIHNDAERKLREDLRPKEMTEAAAAAIADTLLDERYAKGQQLSMNAENFHFNKRDSEHIADLALPEKYNTVEYEVPVIRQGQRLEFVRMADENDLIRAEVNTPTHKDILNDGVPLQSLKGYAVIGLPPGDLERNQDQMADARNNGELALGVYKITNALHIKDYDL